MTNNSDTDFNKAGSKTHANDETDFVSVEAEPAPAAATDDLLSRLRLVEQQLTEITASGSQKAQHRLKGCTPLYLSCGVYNNNNNNCEFI